MTDISSSRRKNLAAVAAGYKSLSELARKVGRSPQQISGMLTGQKSFGTRIARDIEKILGLPYGSLDETREGAMEPKNTKMTGDSGDAQLNIEVIDVEDQDYGLVEPPKQVESVELLRVKTSWLFSQRVSTTRPGELRLITATSDCMDPKIRKGDLVIVDTSQDKLTVNGIYALQISGAICINRVQMLPDKRVALKYDNPNYETTYVDSPEKLLVIGRAIVVFNINDL